MGLKDDLVAGGSSHNVRLPRYQRNDGKDRGTGSSNLPANCLALTRAVRTQ
jgi:hypothetical protein